MTFELPPIVKLAQRVRLDIEQAVRGFARYHKYQVGSVLRTQAFEVVSICNRAWRDRGRQLEHTGKLVFAIDDLKFTKRISSEIDQRFQSDLALLIADLNAQPKTEKAKKPFGPIKFVRGNSAWWAECPQTGYGFPFKTLRAAVAGFQVRIVGHQDGNFIGEPTAT
jgi:hypothetical protein